MGPATPEPHGIPWASGGGRRNVTVGFGGGRRNVTVGFTGSPCELVYITDADTGYQFYLHCTMAMVLPMGFTELYSSGTV